MTGEPQKYTVATTAQLLGGNKVQPNRRGSIRRTTTKTTMKTGDSGQADKTVETLKAVHFAPQKKVVDYNQSINPSKKSDVSILVHKSSHETARFSNTISAKALQETSGRRSCSHDRLRVPKTSHHAGSAAHGITRSVSQKNIPLGPKQTTVLKPKVRMDTSDHSTGFESSHDNTRAKVSDIYFTPMNVDCNSTYLSSPIGEITTGSGESSKTEKLSQSTEHGFTDSPSIEGGDQKLELTFTQLNQLVCALARSPMVSDNIHRHWWSDIDQALMHSITPVDKFYSQPNHQFVTKPMTSQEHEPESPVLGHHANSLLVLPQDISSIAITDPGVHGSPVRFISRTFRPASIGTCTFLNLPYGSHAESALVLDTCSGSNNSKHETPSKVTLQIVSRIVDRKTGQRNSLLICKIDVSHELRTAALAELGAQTGRAPSDIVFPPSSTDLSSARTDQANCQPSASEAVDWIELADTLQRTSELADAVDTAAERLAGLRPCSPARASGRGGTRKAASAAGTRETRAFLAHVNRLKETYSRFWVLRPGREAYESGVPKSVGVPWVSGLLYADLCERRTPMRAGEEMMSALAGRVAKVGREPHEFEELVRGEIVRFVPVFGGVGNAGEVGAWVCFVSKGADG